MIIPRRKPYFAKNIFRDSLNLLVKRGYTSEVSYLEKDIEKNLDLKNVLAVASGRVGLYLILKFSNLPKKSEIIIPGYTFGTLTKFIKKAGYIPTPVDIDPETFQLDPTKINQAINNNTSAILATHIFGEPCDILTIKKIAQKNRLMLIEDCAESLGALVKGKPTGSFGDVALSSFDIAKPLQGIRGGVIFGNNKVLIDRVRNHLSPNNDHPFPSKEVLRAILGCFISQSLVWPIIIYLLSFEKFRNRFVSTYRSTDKKTKIILNLSPFLAHITRLNLQNFKLRILQRQKIYTKYKKGLAKIMDFQKTQFGSSGNKYMIVCKIKKDPIYLRRFLALKGIDIAIQEEIADDILFKPNSEVKKIYEKTIALPVFETLTISQIDFISGQVKYFLLNKKF